MGRYLTISEEVQIVRGNGCGFLPGAPKNDLESVEALVVAWIADNPGHPDVGEAKRWLDAAAPRIERIHKERKFLGEVAAFKNDLVARLRARGHMWASWEVDRYQSEVIRRFEEDLRKRMGLD